MPEKIAGKARELIEGANFAHITYPFREPGEERVLFRIEPEKVLVYGD